jgi:hypothetical protein
MPAATPSAFEFHDWRDLTISDLARELLDTQDNLSTVRELFLQALGLWHVDIATQANTNGLLIEQVRLLKSQVAELHEQLAEIAARS